MRWHFWLNFALSWLGWLVVTGLLVACSSAPVIRDFEAYSADSRKSLLMLEEWRLLGRVAVQTAEESWNANLDWRRHGGADHLRFYGPLGQGAVSVQLDAEVVVIDRGDGEERYGLDQQTEIARRLGVSVPLQALRYWVLGVPEPQASYELRWRGFQQDDWIVTYTQMQSTQVGSLPYRARMEGASLVLKLIVDQWEFYDDAGTLGGAR
ncbi:MAG: lipoprotein insertase outer membrane protein LolB [Methylococcales bacterium]|nr:lipoprotein insertase outer membrane protein LolB [Methylococcales bacterium]